MFETVFIEKNVEDSEYTKHILSKVTFKSIKTINSYEDVWGRVKKPYLQKRETLNLFIANKKGTLVKEAPVAYGIGNEKHYYYIHSFNCIYECQYCYLQGFFNSPDIVLFVNHNEIINEMQRIVNTKGLENSWFHAGEYSDSLNLSHVTNEFKQYFEFFKKNKNAKLELRTKSVNIKELLKLSPLKNIYVSFTISSNKSGDAFDFKCPSVNTRLKAIKKLVNYGYNIGIHLDPIIYHENFETGYKSLLEELSKILPNERLGYMSIGVVRFTKDVYREVENNYPESNIHSQDLIKSFDGKVRYNRPMRMWIMNTVKKIAILNNYDSNKVYLCMEE